MKVILSISPIRFPLTGIGRYTFELAKQLKLMPDVENLLLFSNHHFVQDIPNASLASNNFSSFSASSHRSIFKNKLSIEMYRLVSPFIKRQALRGYSDHIFHSPNFYLPPFDGPSLCTFHDLSIYSWAHCHPPERVRFMHKEILLTLQRADMLITDSEYTRQEVVSYFGWPLEKIRAVSLACSSDFRPRSSSDLIPLLAKYGLIPGCYSLYVGTIEPRKNLDALLDAYAMLPLPVRQQWPLILIGHHGWRSEQLHQRIDSAVSEGWARYLGFVTADDLPLIYSGARLFVFPSLYEGFGLPVLEAMASGVPVVCSNSSSLPEVAGDAAAMCSPQDVDALYNLIAKGLEDDTWRTNARQNGLLQANRFSWQRCAEETVSVYRELSS